MPAVAPVSLRCSPPWIAEVIGRVRSPRGPLRALPYVRTARARYPGMVAAPSPLPRFPPSQEGEAAKPSHSAAEYNQRVQGVKVQGVPKTARNVPLKRGCLKTCREEERPRRRVVILRGTTPMSPNGTRVGINLRCCYSTGGVGGLVRLGSAFAVVGVAKQRSKQTWRSRRLPWFAWARSTDRRAARAVCRR